MHKINNLGSIFFAIIAACLLTMGANCPGCNMNKDCGAYNNKRELCRQDKRCYYNNATHICHMRPEGHLAGCYDIDDEIPCKESKDCTYDEVAKVCLQATPGGLCGNIQVPAACDADAACVWDDNVTPAVCKQRP